MVFSILRVVHGPDAREKMVKIIRGGQTLAKKNKAHITTRVDERVVHGGFPFRTMNNGILKSSPTGLNGNVGVHSSNVSFDCTNRFWATFFWGVAVNISD